MVRKLIRKALNNFGYEIVKIKDLPTFFSIGVWVNKLNIETIIDVGSNEGQFIEEISKVLPGKKIIAFEPIKSVYDKLVANTKGMNVTAHNMGLGDEDTTIEINVSKNTVSSSFLEMENLHKETYPESAYVTKETIQVKKLDDVVAIDKEKSNVLLKIDVQGYENKVIAGGTNVIKGSAVIVIEFSFTTLYTGQWLFSDTYTFFANNGFKFVGFADQILNNELGVPLFGDAIFVKETLLPKIYA